MIVSGLNHINVGTDKLADTIAFYRDVLDLKLGWRPNFPFGGAWLYCGETAIVHLVELGAAKAPSREAALDHFALSIDDFDAAIGRLQTLSVRYNVVDIDDTPIRQINIRDPNGVNVELNYWPKLSIEEAMEVADAGC
jgi:catechol 2,3-dioxygenase-like lactoylglutathione lyase family enzyme